MRFKLQCLFLALSVLAVSPAAYASKSSAIKAMVCDLFLRVDGVTPLELKLATRDELNLLGAFLLSESFLKELPPGMFELEGWNNGDPNAMMKGYFVFIVRTLEDAQKVGRLLVKRAGEFAVEDPAEPAAKPVDQPAKKHPSVLIGELAQDIGGYFEVQHPKLGSAWSTKVQALLMQRIFPDSEFLRDPTGFVRNWKSNPSTDGSYRLESYAIEYLEERIYADEIAPIVEKARDAGFVRPRGEEPFSTRWTKTTRASVGDTEAAQIIRGSLVMDVHKFIEKDYPSLSGAQLMAAADFAVQRILADPDFHKDPVGYLNRWTELRTTEEGVVIFESENEKIAYRYFDQIWLKNSLDLVSLGKRAARAGFEVDPKLYFSRVLEKAGRN